MRARKLAAVAMEDLPPPDDVVDAYPDDDPVIDRHDDTTSIDRLCLACGGDGTAHDGCAHGEIARLDEPSRAIRDAVARLERAAAEHRAAVRALRVLVLSEVARGRGDLETAPAPKPEPCPRCLIRDAEEAAAAAGTAKVAKRKAKPGVQQALPFGDR
jgi:hypothetical protein